MKINYNDLNNLDNFIELISDLVFFKNINGEYKHCNSAFLNFNNKTREEVLNNTVFDFYSYENAVKFTQDDKDIFANNKNRSYGEVFKVPDGDDIYFYTTKQIVYDNEGNQTGLFCIAKDVTVKKQYELIYRDSQKILEYIAIHDDLKKILKKIVHLAEERNSSSLCSILLLDETKTHLLTGSAPSIPDFYNEAINGVEIGEKVGSCGSAAFKKTKVIVEDIDTHENWQPYLSLTQKANLHACWSQPILSSKDEILGTFAIYHERQKKPSDFDLKLISSYAHLASVAIEKDYNEKVVLEKEHQVLDQIKISNEKLKSREYELSQIFNNALVGLIYITGDRILVKGNQRLADIFGYENPQEMVGMSMREFHLSQERYVEFGKTNFESLKEKEKFNIEYKLQRKDSSSIWCELSGKALDENTPADLSKGVLWTIKDISRRKKLEKKVKERTKEIELKNTQLEELAAKDHLTGLFNRSKLDEALDDQYRHSKRYKTIFGAIMIDIDYFKQVNDDYGHQAGDTILKEFATLLKNASRETDVIGRWGGEEFLIIVENINKDNLIKLAEKLRMSVEEYKFSIVNHKTASFGVSLYRSGEKINELIARTDKALYQAKDSGRNCVNFL